MIKKLWNLILWIDEYKFYQYSCPVLINDIDINKIALSNKLPFGKKIF